MPAAARLGDAGVPHCSGYVIASGAATVLINGRPAARVGDFSTPHLIPAGRRCVTHTAPIITGAVSVLIEGKPAARVGDRLAGCTAVAQGSFNVIIGF
jgi:uncharacterized Zn-binding protein involved in type VI secretion